ncbi:chaB [Peridroma alphabaculovirus]|uniref:ChaB n=1 Tax=Peridroma alphabaculovirus TaxID=1346829 RepID=A0A068LRG3_9ABAC|nr:chaB [Peridroma alphabaculovirus]AIE47780.1 chaB [Peridroma alphabaculovirus]
MFHLNESFYNQEMPARAKRLFVRTFKKYHKLDGGDEEVALHMARQAVDREYVKLNDRYIPKRAAEEIVRHDLDEDSDTESLPPATGTAAQAASALNVSPFSATTAAAATTAVESDDYDDTSDDYDENFEEDDDEGSSTDGDDGGHAFYFAGSKRKFK